MSYIDGERNQMLLMPSSIEEYIANNDPVRAYDAMIEKIFLEISHKFNFDAKKPGANEYHPKTMLKILVYSYSLESEVQEKSREIFTITFHIYGLPAESNLIIGRYLISGKNTGSP